MQQHKIVSLVFCHFGLQTASPFPPKPSSVLHSSSLLVIHSQTNIPGGSQPFCFILWDISTLDVLVPLYKNIPHFYSNERLWRGWEWINERISTIFPQLHTCHTPQLVERLLSAQESLAPPPGLLRQWDVRWKINNCTQPGGRNLCDQPLGFKTAGIHSDGPDGWVPGAASF